MKILVCIKRVPDTALKIKIADDGTKIDKNGLEYIISPYDEIAVEHALRIKDKIPGTEVIIASLGPADTEKNIRTALAMGADRAILLESSQDTLEGFSIAKALSDAVRVEQPSLILTGVKAGDSDSGQVGPMIAALLDIPFLSTIVSMEVKDGKVYAESEIEGGQLLLESTLPAVISIQKSNVEPRICSLLNIRKAKTKEMKKISGDIATEQWKIINMVLPPDRKGGKIVGQGSDAVPKLFELLKQEAKVL